MGYGIVYKTLAVIITFSAAYVMTEYRLGLLNLALQYSDADYILIFAVNWALLMIFYAMAWMVVTAIRKKFDDLRTRFK